jgi:hypothetical protein
VPGSVVSRDDAKIASAEAGRLEYVAEVGTRVKAGERREFGVERPVATGQPDDLIVVNVLVDALSVVEEESESDGEERRGGHELEFREGPNGADAQQQFPSCEPDDGEAEYREGQ